MLDNGTMNWINTLRLSFPWTVRCVEWFVLLSCLLSGLLSTYFQTKPELLPIFIAYNLIFFAFSLVFPVKQPVWQQRIYIAAQMGIIVSAVWLRLWFDLLIYFVLLKSCLFLKRRDVILIAVLTGLGYVSGDAWHTPQRIAEMVAEVRAQGNAAYNAQAIVLTGLINYAGACLLVIWLGSVIKAERTSRQRAERLTEEVETLAAQLERARIARDIHDALGHTLTTLGVQLELAQKLQQANSSQAIQALEMAQLLATQGLQEVRRSLQPLHQDELNLNQALAALVQQVQRSQALHVQMDIQLPSLSLPTRHQLYCIVKEGLTNIQRHAEASSVRLRSSFTADSIMLELDDNGRGFDVNGLHSGFGLRSMAERVQILGGRIKINSHPGDGTQIRVVIPR